MSVRTVVAPRCQTVLHSPPPRASERFPFAPPPGRRVDATSRCCRLRRRCRRQSAVDCSDHLQPHDQLSRPTELLLNKSIRLDIHVLAPTNRFLSRMPDRSLIDGAARFHSSRLPLTDRHSAEGERAHRAAGPAGTKLREGRTPRSDCDCRIRHRSTALTGERTAADGDTSHSRAASNCADRCCSHCQRRTHEQRISMQQCRVRRPHSFTRDSAPSLFAAHRRLIRLGPQVHRRLLQRTDSAGDGSGSQRAGSAVSSLAVNGGGWCTPLQRRSLQLDRQWLAAFESRRVRLESTGHRDSAGSRGCEANRLDDGSIHLTATVRRRSETRFWHSARSTEWSQSAQRIKHASLGDSETRDLQR